MIITYNEIPELDPQNYTIPDHRFDKYLKDLEYGLSTNASSRDKTMARLALNILKGFSPRSIREALEEKKKEPNQFSKEILKEILKEIIETSKETYDLPEYHERGTSERGSNERHETHSETGETSNQIQE